MTHVAVASAKLTDGAELSASEAEGVVRKDDLGGTIPILVLDVVNEGLDVNGGRATLLARGVIALETSDRLSHSLLDRHQGDISLEIAAG